MQIVVNITENHYKALMKMKEFSLGYYQRAIINGTVLPKGHGDLIDANVLCEQYEKTDGDLYQALDLTRVIIEEDKGENE